MGKTVKLPISNFLLDEPHAHADKLWGPYPSVDAASAAIPTAMKVASFKFGVLSNGVFSEYIYLEDNGTPQELASLKVQLLLNPSSGAVAGKILSLDNDLKPVWVEPSSTAERVSFDNSEEIFDGDVSTTQAAIEALKNLLDALDGDVVKRILVNGSEVSIENGVASITIPDAVTSVIANNELVFQTPDGQSVKGKVGVTTGADGLLHLTLTDEDGHTCSSPIAGLRVVGNALQYSNDGETWTTVQTFGKLVIKYVQASDPASGDVGDLALVGSTNAYVLKVYLGGSWASVCDFGSLNLTSDGIEVKGRGVLTGELDALREELFPFADVDLQNEQSGIWINNNNVWTSDANAKYYLLEVKVGSKYRITATANGRVHYAFLTNNTTSGNAAFVQGTGRVLVEASTSEEFTIPATTAYLYVLSEYDGVRLDSLVEFYESLSDKVERIPLTEGGIVLKQGLFHTTTGVYQANATRAVSMNYFAKGTLITCKEGYFIRGVYMYKQVDGELSYVGFSNFSSYTVYSSFFVPERNNYDYVRLLFQNGAAGTSDVDIDDVIESIKLNVDSLTGTKLYASVEGGGYSFDSSSNPSKTAIANRMRAGGVFSNNGMITVVCKDGYEANITFYSHNTSSEKYATGWRSSHVNIYITTFIDFLIHFRRRDNGNVSSSDYDCVQSFYYGDIISDKIFGKLSRPDSGYVDFTVSCNTTVADTISTAQSLQDDAVMGNDKCRLYLPTTYSEYGTPTRLIIHCHGASVNYNYNNFSALGISTKFLYYFTAQGYAVLIVSGMAGNSTLQIGTTAGSPLAYQCHVKAYQYVVDKYNIYTDGCFVYGISAGSIPALQIANFTDIPVKAQIIYCGIYSVPRAFMLLGGYSAAATSYAAMKQYIADQYDFQGTLESWSGTDPVSDAEWKYIIDNVKRFAGWNTYLKGATTRMSQEEYADFIADYYGSSLPSWIDSQNITFDTIDQLLMAIKVQQKNTASPSGDLLTAINAEKALYDTVSIHRNVPLKIFHATNDATAPYRYARYYYDMLKRGGSQVEFRTFTTGNHDPYGSDITVDGVSTCVTAVESLNFCKRFE